MKLLEFWQDRGVFESVIAFSNIDLNVGLAQPAKAYEEPRRQGVQVHIFEKLSSHSRRYLKTSEKLAAGRMSHFAVQSAI